MLSLCFWSLHSSGTVLCIHSLGAHRIKTGWNLCNYIQRHPYAGGGEIKQMVKLAYDVRPLHGDPLRSAQMQDQKNRNASGRTRSSPVLYSFHSCSSLEIEKYRKQTFLPQLLTFGCVSFHFYKIIWHILPKYLFFYFKIWVTLHVNPCRSML